MNCHYSVTMVTGGHGTWIQYFIIGKFGEIVELGVERNGMLPTNC